ncbi:MAG: transglycosylase SLT domain-containing protein, partial [Alphaproteobacteria bacterium]
MRRFHGAGPATGRLPSAGKGLLLLNGLLAFGTSLTIFPASTPAQTTATETRPAVDAYSAYVAEASQRFGLPEHWIRAVMTAESDGIARSVSSKGAMGLMQIRPDTWIELSARYRLGDDPLDPRDNILAGAAYLR